MVTQLHKSRSVFADGCFLTVSFKQTCLYLSAVGEALCVFTCISEADMYTASVTNDKTSMM